MLATDRIFLGAGIKKFIGCNHVRAHEFFSETILRSHSSCGFWGVECESYDKFINGSCFACTPPVSEQTKKLWTSLNIITNVCVRA